MFETLLRFDQEAILNWLFLILMGLIAWQSFRFRDPGGKADFVRLLFGTVAAIFFFLVLFQDAIVYFSRP